MEAKPTRAASIIPIYVRLHLCISLSDTDAINRRIVQGLLRSDKIAGRLSDIPCNVIQTLENDAGEAEKFVDQLKNGTVPTIIQDLPKEIIQDISDVVGIFASLPTQIVDAAEAAVTDAVNVFNDIESGAIVSDLERIPGVIVSDITNAWGDLTSGLVHDWNEATDAINCFFVGCPVATTTAATGCASTQAITAQTSHPTSQPLSNTPSPTQTRPKTSSSSGQSPTPTAAINVASGFKLDKTILRLNVFQLCCLLGLGSLGVVFLLL